MTETKNTDWKSLGIGVLIGVGATLGYEHIDWQAKWDALRNGLGNTIAKKAKSIGKSGPLAKGGLIDEIWKHPEQTQLGPSEYQRNGTWIKVEQYYNVDMFANPGHVKGKKDASPLETRLQIEERLLGRDLSNRNRILNFLGNISNLTGRVMQKKTKASTIEAANRTASESVFYESVAEAMRIANIVYKSEESMETAFSPDLHQRKHVHLDCNMLSELVKGIATNYGRTCDLVIGNEHMFIQGDKIDFEATAFRNIKEDHKEIDGVWWDMTIHTDAPKEVLIEPKGYHQNRKLRAAGLWVNDYNLQIIRKDGIYRPLTSNEITDVIEGTLRGHFIERANDQDLEKQVRDYIEFAKDVESPWVATQGFNLLAGMANKTIDSYENSPLGSEKEIEAKNQMTYLMEGMAVFSKHEAVKNTGEANYRKLRNMQRFMNNPTLSNALQTIDRTNFTDHGNEQYEKFTYKLMANRNNPQNAIAWMHAEGMNRHVTVPMFQSYMRFLQKSDPEQLQEVRGILIGHLKKLYELIKSKDDGTEASRTIQSTFKGLISGGSYNPAILGQLDKYGGMALDWSTLYHNGPGSK